MRNRLNTTMATRVRRALARVSVRWTIKYIVSTTTTHFLHIFESSDIHEIVQFPGKNCDVMVFVVSDSSEEKE